MFIFSTLAEICFQLCNFNNKNLKVSLNLRTLPYGIVILGKVHNKVCRKKNLLLKIRTFNSQVTDYLSKLTPDLKKNSLNLKMFCPWERYCDISSVDVGLLHSVMCHLHCLSHSSWHLSSTWRFFTHIYQTRHHIFPVWTPIFFLSFQINCWRFASNLAWPVCFYWSIFP